MTSVADPIPLIYFNNNKLRGAIRMWSQSPVPTLTHKTAGSLHTILF